MAGNLSLIFHDFVMSLMISWPISHSQELEIDFSRFLENSNSQKHFGAVGFISKLDIDRKPAKFNEPLAVVFDYILLAYSMRNWHLPPNAHVSHVSRWPPTKS